MGELIQLFKGRELTDHERAHLMQRLTDIAVEKALLDSERERLERRLYKEES